jgi:hypothetical protein
MKKSVSNFADVRKLYLLKVMANIKPVIEGRDDGYSASIPFLGKKTCEATGESPRLAVINLEKKLIIKTMEDLSEEYPEAIHSLLDGFISEKLRLFYV